MELQINKNGNGACPICRLNQDCHIHEAIRRSVEDLSGEDMELVIFSCPKFTELNAHHY